MNKNNPHKQTHYILFERRLCTHRYNKYEFRSVDVLLQKILSHYSAELHPRNCKLLIKVSLHTHVLSVQYIACETDILKERSGDRAERNRRGEKPRPMSSYIQRGCFALPGECSPLQYLDYFLLLFSLLRHIFRILELI